MKLYLIILCILNILSVIFILQINFGLIPLIISSFNITTITNINGLVINISYGFVVSSIFYLIVVYFPEREKRKSTNKIIQSRLCAIANEINKSIHYLYSKRLDSKDVRIDKLEFSHFEPIICLDKRVMKFNYKIKGSHGGWIPFGTGEQLEINSYVHEREIVLSKIDELLALPTIIYIDFELIEILVRLRDCWFYSGVAIFLKSNPQAKVHNFNKGIYDYYLLFLRLKRYALINEFIVINK